MMVTNRRSEEVVDPSIEIKPSTRALKRALLTALRCVDPDSEKRPKMGQVVLMLESEDPIPREVSKPQLVTLVLIVSYAISNLIRELTVDESHASVVCLS